MPEGEVHSLFNLCIQIQLPISNFTEVDGEYRHYSIFPLVSSEFRHTGPQ